MPTVALSFLWSLVTSRIGSVLTVGALAYGVAHFREHSACNERAVAVQAEIARAVIAERARREAAITLARNFALADVARLQDEKNTLESKLKESANASRANDRSPCLDVRSVRRLKQF